MLSNDRNTMRQVYFDAWAKYRRGELLEGMEQAIVDVIINHPEYQFIFDDPQRWQEEEQFPGTGDTNPFMHFGLHLAVLEQIHTNRPSGVKAVFERLAQQDNSTHDTLHRMMDCLSRWLADAGEQQKTPDEAEYLEALAQLQSHR